MSDDAQPEIHESPIQDFVLDRVLAEVYLLLDNVSMSTGKTLPPKPAPAKGGKAHKPDLVEEICKVTWPPTGVKADRGHQAATLFRARDVLNTHAAPATGATIAFTLLVAGEDTPQGSGLRGWFRSIGRLIGIVPKPKPHRRKAHADAAADATAAHDETAGAAVIKSPSRLSLAHHAYPNLVRRAASFRLFLRASVVVLFAAFVFTAGLSWNVAAGNAALAEWTKVTADIAKQAADAADDQGDGTTATEPVVPAHPAVGAPSTSVGTTAPNAQTPHGPAMTPQQARDLAFAGENLNHWLSGWAVLGYPDRIPAPSPTSRHRTTSLADTVNAQWAGALLNVLGGTVLPIFYGLLGAGASVVRQLSARIRDSILAPRHLMLSLVQLTLGAVIGSCIGLFVTPSGAPSSTTPGLLGSVPLSASALCFIAGFGVKSAFKALEGLIQRVFSQPDPNAKP